MPAAASGRLYGPAAGNAEGMAMQVQRTSCFTCRTPLSHYGFLGGGRTLFLPPGCAFSTRARMYCGQLRRSELQRVKTQEKGWREAASNIGIIPVWRLFKNKQIKISKGTAPCRPLISFPNVSYYEANFLENGKGRPDGHPFHKIALILSL